MQLKSTLNVISQLAVNIAQFNAKCNNTVLRSPKDHENFSNFSGHSRGETKFSKLFWTILIYRLS